MHIDGNLLNGVLSQLLLFVVTILASLSVELIRRKIGVTGMEKVQATLEAKQGLAATAVQFAEQAFETAGGAQKYEQALGWLTNTAQRHGISITPDEAKGLIEAAVKDMKISFGAAWKAAEESKPAT